MADDTKARTVGLGYAKRLARDVTDELYERGKAAREQYREPEARRYFRGAGLGRGGLQRTVELRRSTRRR